MSINEVLPSASIDAVGRSSVFNVYVLYKSTYTSADGTKAAVVSFPGNSAKVTKDIGYCLNKAAL